ncbi:MAG: alpha-2-macroglobulin family protein [Bacteroidota bacterium]
MLIDQENNIQLVGLDYQGEAARGRNLTVKMWRVEWRWWWENSNRGGRYRRNSSQDLRAEAQLTTGADGTVQWPVEIEKWGRYRIQVCDNGSGHCAATYVYAGSPWYDEQSFSEEATLLTFKAERETYEVGEEVQLTFPAGSKGRALLSLENGSGVVQEYWIDTQAGDNTYRFTVDERMTPTIYAHLTVLQPHDQEENDLPLRSYGIIPIEVTDANTTLQPVVKMADELRPDEAFAVNVSETDGKPMTYTLAVVDEGLLSLTRFKTPDPHAAFYAREALGVKTWDMYNHVLGKSNTQFSQLLSIGGDGEASGPPEPQKANRFRPVVLHLGPFELAAGQRVRHDLKMPNYVGAVRVMVVAAERSGRYGAVDKTVPVRKPLMLLATLPRVLGVGESLALPVNVFAMKSGLGNVRVKVKESTGLVQIAQSQQQLNFSQTGDQVVRFPIQTGERTGIARFTVTVEGGGEKSTQEIEIDVRNPNPSQRISERFVLAPGEEKTLPYEPFGTVGTREGILEVTNLPPLNLEERLDYLLGYPYGCLEQTVSKAFPQLFLERFVSMTAQERTELRDNVQAALNKLRDFQNTGGRFSYWPGRSNYYNEWSNSYAGHFLLAAKEAGYTIPGGLLNDWLAGQAKAARAWDPAQIDAGLVRKSSYTLNQAYRLYTLALAGQAELGAMNRLREQSLSTVSSWRLAAAYALVGQSGVAKGLVSTTATTLTDYRELGYTFGSRMRDRAMIVETLLLLDRQDDAALYVQMLSDRMSSKSWLSTQEIAFTLFAFSKYIGENEQLQKTYTFTAQQSGETGQDIGAQRPYFQLLLKDRSSTVTVKNTSQQRLFGAIIRTGQARPAEEVAVSNALALDVTYKDTKGRILDVKRLPQGTDFVAEVQVRHPSVFDYRYEELALAQVFPAGWEIVNTRFEQLSTDEEYGYNYRDFRDDRVHTFFHLGVGQQRIYRVNLTATYAGRFYLPASTCEAMYDEKINAAAAGRWVEVVGNQ